MAQLNVYFLCLLFVVSAKSLEAPKGVKVTFLEPAGVYIEWNELSFDEKRYVDGYKVKVWTIKEETTRNYKLLNGEQYPGLERNDYAREPFNDRMSEDFTEITLNVPINYARVKNLMFNKLYEIRVFAYKGDVFSPMSDPRRVKLVKNDNFMLLAERKLDACVATIITNKTATSDEPFVYNTVL